MTPERAEAIFYERYSRSMDEWKEVNKPLVQSELRRASWQAVIDVMNDEPHMVILKTFLEGRADDILAGHEGMGLLRVPLERLVRLPHGD